MTEEELFLRFRYLVKPAIRKYARRFAHLRPFLFPEDIQQYAEIGLLKAIRANKYSFDDKRFYSYAHRKIAGSIIDAVRQLTHRGKSIQPVYLDDALAEPGMALYIEEPNSYVHPKRIRYTR